MTSVLILISIETALFDRIFLIVRMERDRDREREGE